MLWEHGVAGSSPAIPICPCDGTGIRAGIRVQILQVQILSGVFGDFAGMKQEWLGGLISLTSAGAIPAPVTKIVLV